MAPLPENSTARLFVRMTGDAGIHHTVFRFSSLVSIADAVTRARAVCTLAAALLDDSVKFDMARWQTLGSNISLPVSWGTAISGAIVGTLTGEYRPQFLSFTGRSPDGRRCRLTFFGWTGGMGTDYRYHRAESAGVAAVLDSLQGGTPSLVSISGGAVVWNDYANAGRNAYFQRKLRRTG